MHCIITVHCVKQELHLLKSRNLYLTEKNEADESKLQVAEDSRKELEEVSYKHKHCILHCTINPIRPLRD